MKQVYYREKGGFMERRKLENLCVYSKQYLEAGTLATRKAYSQVRLASRLVCLSRAPGIFLPIPGFSNTECASVLVLAGAPSVAPRLSLAVERAHAIEGEIDAFWLFRII